MLALTLSIVPVNNQTAIALSGSSLKSEVFALGEILIGLKPTFARQAKAAIAANADAAQFGIASLDRLNNTFAVQKIEAVHNTGQIGGRMQTLTRRRHGMCSAAAARPLIAIIDIGVDYTHPDLDASRIRTDTDKDFVNVDDNAKDDHGHGTYCAGIVAANTNNARGMAGVYPNCKILPVNQSGAFARSAIIRMHYEPPPRPCVARHRRLLVECPCYQLLARKATRLGSAVEPTLELLPPHAYLLIILSPQEDLIYVRTYFSDRSMLNVLGDYADLNETEVSLDGGYIVLEITPAQKIELEELGLRVVIDQALMAQARDFRGGEVGVNRIPSYTCYRTVEETFDVARQIVAQRPNLAEWIDIGDSWEKTQNLARGYDLMVLVLTNRAISSPKPKLFIMSGVHAREYTQPELATRFAEYLASHYGLDPDVTWMLDQQEVHLLLQANPDGPKKAESGLSWRKNTGSAFCSNTNSRGIGLNRNFSFLWNTCQGSSCGSNDQRGIVYRGPSASSEPETQAIQNYLRTQFADNREPPLNASVPFTTSGVMIDIHSYGQLVLWPYANGTMPANNDGSLMLVDRMSFYNGHDPRQGSGLYLHNGVSDDFAYGELGVAAFTFELGTSFFRNCATFESSIYEGNLCAPLYAAKVTCAPYLLPSGPEAISVTVSSASVASGMLAQLSATVDDDWMKKGLKPAQAIAAARYTIDTPPWQSGATFFLMTASNSVFNSASERVAAMINISDLAAGRHIVYVQGQDAQGNWGLVGSAFLMIQGDVILTPTLIPTPATPTPPPPTPTSTPIPVLATPTTTPTLPTPTPGNVLFADDFETDKGWQVNPTRTDRAVRGKWERGRPQATAHSRWAIQLRAANGAFDLVTGPLASASIGQHDVDGGVTSVRSPAIALPALAAGQNLTFRLNYYFAHTANSSADDYLRIKIVGSTTAIVFEELGATNYAAAAWAQLNVNLNAFAGQTVYVLIEGADLGGPSLVEAAIDDLVIRVE